MLGFLSELNVNCPGVPSRPALGSHKARIRISGGHCHTPGASQLLLYVERAMESWRYPQAIRVPVRSSKMSLLDMLAYRMTCFGRRQNPGVHVFDGRPGLCAPHLCSWINILDSTHDTITSDHSKRLLRAIDDDSRYSVKLRSSSRLNRWLRHRLGQTDG